MLSEKEIRRINNKKDTNAEKLRLGVRNEKDAKRRQEYYDLITNTLQWVLGEREKQDFAGNLSG